MGGICRIGARQELHRRGPGDSSLELREDQRPLLSRAQPKGRDYAELAAFGVKTIVEMKKYDFKSFFTPHTDLKEFVFEYYAQLKADAAAGKSGGL